MIEELIISPRIFMLAVWAQLVIIIFFRGAIYGDLAKDMPKQLKVWEFYRADTSMATRLLVPAVAVWILMWFTPLEITLGL
jgi:hypothetical protein